MQNTPKTKNYKIETVGLFAASFILLAFFITGQHRQTEMDQYAKNNNCTWYYNGTAYGDNRDYTCK